MNRNVFLIIALSIIASSCQIHYRDLTPPSQPNWQGTFDFTNLENVEVWPYLTPEANLLYSSTKDVLLDYAENMGYHFYLEIKADRGISNIRPAIIINGERYDMDHVSGTTGGVWFHREFAQTTCGVDDYAYYYEIRFKRAGYNDTQIAKLYSESEPAHSTIALDEIITVTGQNMKPVANSAYSMKTGFPSGTPQEIKVILSNRTDVDIKCVGASIVEDFEEGYPGCGNEFQIIEHPSYTYPSPIACGTYVHFKIKWTPTFYGSATDVPSNKTKAKISLMVTYQYEEGGMPRTENKSIDIYGLYQ